MREFQQVIKQTITSNKNMLNSLSFRNNCIKRIHFWKALINHFILQRSRRVSTLEIGTPYFFDFFVLLHSSIHYIYYSIIKSCRSLLHPVILGVGKYMFSSYRDFTYTILIYIMSSIRQQNNSLSSLPVIEKKLVAQSNTQ